MSQKIPFVLSAADDVATILHDQVSPLLRSHGGDVTLLRVVGNQVYVRFTGACRCCPAANDTLEHTIRHLLCTHYGDDSIEVILENGVSDDLIAEAKKILQKSKIV